MRLAWGRFGVLKEVDFEHFVGFLGLVWFRSLNFTSFLVFRLPIYKPMEMRWIFLPGVQKAQKCWKFIVEVKLSRRAVKLGFHTGEAPHWVLWATRAVVQPQGTLHRASALVAKVAERPRQVAE